MHEVFSILPFLQPINVLIFSQTLGVVNPGGVRNRLDFRFKDCRLLGWIWSQDRFNIGRFNSPIGARPKAYSLDLFLRR